MPKEQEEVDIMLHTFMLDKALYELGYELNNRPEWDAIPVRAIRDLLSDQKNIPKGEQG
jgi:maltose alpha-D-glucosyltransferase/alpha-amylase